MEELLSQPVNELVQTIFSTTTSQIIAGIVLWYLTGAVWICRWWASDVFSEKGDLIPSSGNMGYHHMPLVWVFSPLLMLLVILIYGIEYLVCKPWVSLSYFLLPKGHRQYVKQNSSAS